MRPAASTSDLRLALRWAALLLATLAFAFSGSETVTGSYLQLVKGIPP